MKAGKLLDRLKDILSNERQAQLAKYKSLKKVLKSLRLEKVKLKKELENPMSDENRKKTASKLKIISVQLNKGLKVLKELNDERRRK
jgi:hypothetical protein